MYLTRNAGSFGQHGAKLCFYPSHAPAIELPCQERQAQDTDTVKPVCLVEIWFQIKTERGALLVPHTVFVAGDYLEPVVTWPQTRIVSDAAGPSVDPVWIKAFQLVFEADLLGSYKA